jgi:hypothetical protein
MLNFQEVIMDPKPVRRSRGLYAWEITEARTVFGNSLAYERVHIHEGVGWPDYINVIGRKLRGQPAPGPKDHNAVTLFYNCNFPVNLPQSLPDVSSADDYFVDWLIHELTHAWQNQHTGPGYLVRALKAQFTLENPYDYGGERNLKEVRSKSKTISFFNLEAQATITQDYYRFKRHGWNISAFEPFIDDVRNIS